MNVVGFVTMFQKNDWGFSSTSKQPDYSPLSVKRVNKLFDVHTVQLFFCEAVCLGNEDARAVCLVTLISSGLVLRSLVLKIFFFVLSTGDMVFISNYRVSQKQEQF